VVRVTFALMRGRRMEETVVADLVEVPSVGHKLSLNGNSFEVTDVIHRLHPVGSVASEGLPLYYGAEEIIVEARWC
jgi:hypothetical protein